MNLKDKKLYYTVLKVFKDQMDFQDSRDSKLLFDEKKDQQDKIELFRELEKFYKVIEGHKKLLTAIGNL